MTRLLKWIALLWLGLAWAALAQPVTTQVNSNLFTTQCANGVTILSGGVGLPTTCGAGFTPTDFGGPATGGSANAQTMATRAGTFTLSAGNKACGVAGFTNTGATTLAVDGTTATAINRRSTAGLTALVRGEMQAGVGYCWFYDGTVYELFEAPIAGAVEVKNASYVATAADNGDTYVFTAAATITLPISSHLPNNFRITVYAEGGNVTVTPDPSDQINGGGAGASVTILSGASTLITTDGAGHIYAPVLSAGSGTVSAGTTDQLAYYPSPGGTSVGGTAMPVIAPQGRLTLASATPVMTATVTASSTVYDTPYLGQAEPLWDGTAFMPVNCAEVSNILGNAATGNAGPAAAVAGSVYDLFIWNNGGPCTLTRGPAWTNTTTRSAGTALTRVNGVLVNNAGITNGPNAGFGTYVGTVFTDAGGATVTWNRGGAASGGTAGVLDVWNYYNRVSTGATITDSGVAYTYSSITTRQARASAGNQVTFVIGVQEDNVIGNYNAVGTTAAASGAVMEWGIGLNSTTANGSGTGIIKSVNASGIEMGQAENVSWFAPIGVNVMSANEGSDGTNANSFDSLANNVLSMAGRF